MGFSRLASLSIVLAATLLLSLFAHLRKSGHKLTRSLPIQAAYTIPVFCGLSSLILFSLLRLSSDPRHHLTSQYPLILGIFLLVCGCAALLGWQPAAFRDPRFLWPSLVLAAAALLTWFGFGVRPVEDIFYGYPGVPVTAWQVLLAVMLAVGLVWAGKSLRLLHADRLLVLLIWLAACLVWLASPLVPSRLALAPQAPTWQIYPFSDAQSYDWYAINLLDGMRFNAVIPPRPLYIGFLALLRGIAGLDYLPLVRLQVLVLALVPVLVYLIGLRLGGRTAALAAAFLVILRDENTNRAAYATINPSYSRLLLSELPTALLLLAALWLVLRWQESGWRAFWYPALAAGFIGLAGLVRTQSLIILPALFLLSWLRWDRQQLRRWQLWLPQMAAAVLMTGAVLLPWLARNQALTGGWVFDDPRSQTAVFAYRLSKYSHPADVSPLPGEDDALYTRRLYQIAWKSLRSAPGPLLSDMLNHMANNLFGSLRVLPLRENYPAASSGFALTPPFWEFNLTSLQPPGMFLFVFYLLLLGFGIARAWQNQRWLGLAPLAMNLAYNAWSGAFLTSGQRFLLPVDWAFLLYMVSGLVSLPVLWKKCQRPSLADIQILPINQRAHALRWVPAAVLILLAGAAVPWMEWVIPARYPAAAQAELLARLKAEVPPTILDPLTATLDDLVVYQGRMLHPLYFAAGEGLWALEDAGYTIEPYGRLVFRLSGPVSSMVVLPAAAEPAGIVNGDDVLVLGVQQGDVLRATLLQTPTGYLLSSP